MQFYIGEPIHNDHSFGFYFYLMFLLSLLLICNIEHVDVLLWMSRKAYNRIDWKVKEIGGKGSPLERD